jgi:hypothetical protein
MVVVTNRGSISYVVKKKNYDNVKAIDIYNESVSIHNIEKNIRDY